MTSRSFFFQFNRISFLVACSLSMLSGEEHTASAISHEAIVAVYSQAQGGEALWQERQLVRADAQGDIHLLVGQASSWGVPREFLASAGERWLGVWLKGEEEQPRVLLASLRPFTATAGAGRVTGNDRGSGPLLYSIIVRSNATIGAIPRISSTYTLENSLITDDGSSVHIGGLSISASGIVTFSGGQTFPGGAVQSVSAGNSYIIIGGTLANPTVALDTSAAQVRITGSCPPSVGITAVNPDGTLVCGTTQTTTSTATTLITLDNKAYPLDAVDQYTSVAIGADGLALISYWDASIFALRVAHCSNITCSSSTKTPYDPGVAVYDSSVTIGGDGLGLISYYDATNNRLRVAHCNNVLCSSATLITLDSFGGSSSVTTGSDGLGLISYKGGALGPLKVAHCSNAACSSAVTYILDSAPSTGFFTSVTRGADGLGLISYYENTNGNLRVAHCNDVPCTSATTNSLDAPGGFTSVTIGVDGLGLISYHSGVSGALKIAHCNDVICSSAALNTLDASVNAGSYSSVTIGADGLGLISYSDKTNGDLKVAHCNNTSCSSAVLNTVDSTGNVGEFNAIAIGADGLALISYIDLTNVIQKVAHCASVPCGPYSFTHRGR